MSVETKRIYKIDKDDFYGITQGTRPIVDDKGNIMGHVQNPVATIRYEDRLLVVEPYQVEFEDTTKDISIAWHTGSGYGDNTNGYLTFGEFIKKDKTTADDIIRYAQSVGNETMMCEFTDKGFKELIITWEE